jgi:hypothetical protein
MVKSPEREDGEELGEERLDSDLSRTEDPGHRT